eukprot:TRINITY_DN3121_c0_g1_i1.p1 TRINITY_DN3121_c0_g1~~TRINITY_DN3121_c0_g1_i1.p1  ORF type:complete len:101 (+),score=25.27 TRINITY_DN3121_c0_g1_i1:525-827(+)
MDMILEENDIKNDIYHELDESLRAGNVTLISPLKEYLKQKYLSPKLTHETAIIPYVPHQHVINDSLKKYNQKKQLMMAKEAMNNLLEQVRVLNLSKMDIE